MNEAIRKLIENDKVRKACPRCHDMENTFIPDRGVFQCLACGHEFDHFELWVKLADVEAAILHAGEVPKPSDEECRQRALALKYALALMRDRMAIEAPENAAIVQRHIYALIELVAGAVPPVQTERTTS